MEYSIETNEKAIRAKAIWYTVIINLILLGGLLLATSPEMMDSIKKLWNKDVQPVEQPVADTNKA
ncbi:MAG TPA: hypothetical protein P5275_14860 [Saprospiraceae bacterium]|nr:hypothetical protein [Saprospiraceae bacterium]MCB9269283.1 hypothetical protein [Lewinellaceae bacterium]HPG06771.1 hypothetical protein [Saprospiraceae bacterium]HPQ98935.1 hypothetical protein [Saprospiraceae bacterium]HQU52530.1 hypothetical protein [Saprospiraceae bacterium]